MSRRRRRPDLEPAEPVTIEALSHEGRGIARVEGKTVFVENALPGETVKLRVLRQRRSFDEASAGEILKASPDRSAPICSHYHACGGCSLQHLSPEAQLRHKENVLLEQLRHAGGITPAAVLPPLRGPAQGYRSRARLSAKLVRTRNEVLVGFREKRSNHVADIENCPVLDPRLSALLPELSALISSLDIRDAVPQIEAAAGGNHCAFVIRHLRALGQGDRELLENFSAKHGLTLYLQPGGEDSIQWLAGPQDDLSYRLEDEGIEIGFGPTQFTQVNFEINRSMVRRVLELLEPGQEDQVLDLFCGVGNFSLPLARHAAFVTGAEGSAALVERARGNARRNGVENVEFIVADLESLSPGTGVFSRAWPRILLDPPRTGARHAVAYASLDRLEALVYVSCNPATFARDASILVNERGLKLEQVGVMDMFPHTSHVESIALFKRA